MPQPAGVRLDLHTQPPIRAPFLHRVHAPQGREQQSSEKTLDVSTVMEAGLPKQAAPAASHDEGEATDILALPDEVLAAVFAQLPQKQR